MSIIGIFIMMQLVWAIKNKTLEETLKSKVLRAFLGILLISIIFMVVWHMPVNIDSDYAVLSISEYSKQGDYIKVDCSETALMDLLDNLSFSRNVYIENFVPHQGSIRVNLVKFKGMHPKIINLFITEDKVLCLNNGLIPSVLENKNIYIDIKKLVEVK